MPLRGDCLLPISQGVALGWGLIAPSGRYRIHTDNHSHPFMANYMIIICSFLLYVVLCCLMLFDFFTRIDIQVFSSFCVDRKKKQERTANTLRRRTNGLSGVWLRNSRLRRSDSPRPRRHRKASFVTDGSRYRSPG